MEAEPPQRWAATYTKHVKQKRKAYHDGALLLYPASGRLVLLDDAGDTLESRFLRSSEEVSPGAALSFHAHLVDVGEPEDGPARYTSSSAPAAAGSRAARRGGGAARARPPSSGRAFPPRVPRAFVNPSKSRGCGGGGDGEAAGYGDAEVVDSRFQEWTALYTAQMTQKAKKYHDGFVRLVQAGPHVKQIVLLDEDGQVLGSRHLKSGESIESGKKCHFPNYLIEICESKNQNKGGEHTSEESMVHTRPKNGETTSNKMGLGALSKSQKFLSPHKFHEVSTSSGKTETDKVEEVAAGRSLAGSLMEADSGFKEWNALYTTQLTQKAKKYHDGIIRLMQIGSHARQIVLLDEYGEVLGSRYLKSVESVESGTKCQLPNYLIEVCELRNQTNEPKHSSKDALNQTAPRNDENTSDKESEKSKSPKFVSPFKARDAQKSNRESIAISNRPQISKTTCSNLGAPQNCHELDLQRRKSDCNANRGADYGEPTFDIHRGSAANSLPDFWKSISSRVGDPLQFHDLQDGKSRSSDNTFIRREVGKSTFGNMDDSLRTASQILSIMKPPSEVRISQSSQSGQTHSLASSEARVAFDVNCRKNSVVDDPNRNFNGSGASGMSHFAIQLRASVQSCLNLETVPRKNSVRAHHWNESSGNSHPTHGHHTIMRPAAFEGQDSAMFDIPASHMSNAQEQKLDSSSEHTGSCVTESCFNINTDPGLQEDKSGSANQLRTQNDTTNGQHDVTTTSTYAYTLTCKDPKIQELIDDCPSFDLGF